MNKPLRLLLVEDSEDDERLLLRELARGGYRVTHARVQTAEAMQTMLSRETWDAVISDYVMPKFSALGALKVLKASGVDVPLLIVSGTIGEDTAVEALKAGAHDFLVKDRLLRLLPALERELREAAIRRDRRAAERALREEELKYRRIVETAQEGIWVLDESAHTTYSNKRMAELLSTTPAELEGVSIFDFVDDDWKAVVRQQLAQREPGVPAQHDLQFRRSDGTEFFASVSTQPILDDAGTHAGTLAMVTDVTEQRRLHAQLMVADRMVSMGTLAAGVAHEINNPLTAVIANLELALRQAEDMAEAAQDRSNLREHCEQLSDAREGAVRVRDIVKELKMFSRGEDETRGPVDVNRVLDSCLRMAWNEIRHRAKVVKEYAEVPLVEANESRLGQVFLNLIVNAVQAIAIGRAHENEIRLRSSVDRGGRVVVEISDTGQGMAPDVLRRLFTPFFTTKAIGEGTGLGLSICHRIVSALDGEISVDSEPGEGSTFRVKLPAAGANSRPAQARTSTAAPPAQRGRVLVIDDEPVVQKVIQRSLRADHDVVLTGSALEAADLLRRGERFDLILCDLMMPEMTGMDLYRELEQQLPEQAQRMIFLTGGAFTAATRAFMDQLDERCIEKPFSTEALRALVNERIRS